MKADKDIKGTKKERDFLKSKGWELINGFKLDTENVEYDVSYYGDISDLYSADILSKCWYWTNGDELAFDTIDKVLDYEEYEEE